MTRRVPRHARGAVLLAEERRRHRRKRTSETRIVARSARRLVRSYLVLDLSVAGARLLGRADQMSREVGPPVTLEFQGERGLACVRWIGECAYDRSKCVWGVEWADAGDRLRQAIRDRLEEEQSALEWVWRHTRWLD